MEQSKIEKLQIGPNSDTERWEVLSQIGALIAAHVDPQMKTGGEVVKRLVDEKYVTPNIPEELKDDDTPLFSLLRNIYNNFLVFYPLAEDGLYESWTRGVESEYYQVNILNDIESELAHARKLVNKGTYKEGRTEQEREHLRLVSERKAMDFVVERSRASHNEDGDLDFKALVVCAYVAMKNFPPTGAQIAHRAGHPSAGRASGRQINFDKAIAHLQAMKDKSLTTPEAYHVLRYNNAIEENRQKSLTPEEREHFFRAIIPLMAKEQLQMSAEAVLEFFEAEERTGESLRTELKNVFELSARIDALMDVQKNLQGIEAADTGWVILPGTFREIIRGGSGLRGAGIYELDWNRLAYLAQIVEEVWGEGFIAVADLQSVGENEYYVAVLPETVRDEHGNETIIYHAVADNPTKDHNASFVWRGDSNTGITWKQVFNQEKDWAKELGARKIVHKKHYKENIIEYLTRPLKDLDKPGYERETTKRKLKKLGY